MESFLRYLGTLDIYEYNNDLKIPYFHINNRGSANFDKS